MTSTGLPEYPPVSGKRRSTGRPSLLRALADRVTNGDLVRFDSGYGALWTLVVALDFYWLADPVVVLTFDESLHRACVATAIAVVLTLPRIQLPRPAWSVLAILTFCLVSSLWSINPDATIDAVATYFLIATLATVIASNADARTIAQGVTLGGVVILAMSLWAAHEDLARAHVPVGAIGTIAGIGGNRNILAYTMLLSLSFSVSYLPRRWWARLLWALAAGAIGYGLRLAQSGTGVVAGVLLIAAAAVLALIDWRRPTEVVPGARLRSMVLRAAAVLVLVGGAFSAERLGRMVGRDPSTLTGRVPLWKAVWSSTTGVDRWFGSGWGAVWPHGWLPAPDNPVFQTIVDGAGALLYHGHNSLFDLIPEIGLVGAAVFALTYVQAVRRALAIRDARRRTTRARLEASRTTLLGVIGLVLFGLTEPMSTVPLGWFLIVLLATGLVPRREPGTPAGGAPGRRRAERGRGRAVR